MGRAREERELSLLAKVDEATIKRSIDRMNELSRGFNAAADAEVRLDRATARSEATLGDLSNETRQQVSVIRQRIAATKLDIQAQQDYLKITRKETDAIEQQTRAQDKLNKERKEGRSGGISTAERAGSISSATGAISTLTGSQGALGGAFNIVSDLTQVVEYLPRLSEALTGVKAAGGAAQGGAIAAAGGLGTIVAAAAIAAPAIIAVAVVTDKFIKNIEVLNTRLDDAVEAQTKYYSVIQSGTSESIRAEIEAAEQRRNAVLNTLDDLREGYESLSTEQRALANVFLGTSGNIKDLENELNKSTVELEALKRALNSSEVAARDAANELERQAGFQRTANEAIINRIASESAFYAKSDDLTRQQYDSEIERIEERRQAIDLELAALKEADDGSAIFMTRIADLTRERTTLADQELYLKNNTRLLIIEREKEARTIEAQKKSLDKANTLRDARLAFDEGIKTLDQKTAQERLKIAEQANKDLLRIETKRLESIADLEQDFQRTDLKASAKLETDIAKIEGDAREQELELRKESATRIEDLEIRAARERQRILEDYNDSALDAIQNRDAVALDAAQRTRNKALRDNKRQLDDAVKEEKRAFKERLDEAKKSNRERINDLRASYAQERRDRQEALQQRIADINANAAQESAAVNQRRDEQLSALTQHYTEELNKLKTALGELLREYGIYYGNLQTTTQAELDLLALRWEEYFRRVGQATPTDGSGGSSGVGGGGVDPTPAARGIRNFRNGKLIVGEEGPELLNVRNGAVDVLSNSDTRSAFSGMAQAVRGGGSNSYASNNVTFASGAFQNNFPGADPVRMMREMRRQMRGDMRRALVDLFEKELS